MADILTPEEKEHVKEIQDKLNKKIIRALKKVQKTGEVGKETGEMLEINDLITFSPPIPGVSNYNCYKLTEKGNEFLRIGKMPI